MPLYDPLELTLERPALEALQRRKLAALLEAVRASNPFYQRKLAGVRFDPLRDPLHALPLTTRDEVQQDQQDCPPYGANLTYPRERYTRLHQTSGSSGAAPLRWLDTVESWQWWKKCWAIVHAAAGVGPADRVAFAFSFGPFIGFWSAFESAADLGALCLPAGGMNTHVRLRYMLDNAATVVCCTPTYALHMAEVAAAQGIDLAGSPVRALIVAGEPGGGIPAVRQRIETAWGARLLDHAGMTEIGAWGFQFREQGTGNREQRAGAGLVSDAGALDMFVIESEFIAEVIDPVTLAPLPDGKPGELVLTNLGRLGSPLIRYRTGDQVVLRRDSPPAGRRPHARRMRCTFARAVGGVLGRIDDMLIIRGNNIYPAAIEGLLHGVPEVAEFRYEVATCRAMAELKLVIEPRPDADPAALPQRVVAAFRERFNLRPIVELVAPGGLPRFELKARRRVERGSEKRA